MRGPSVRGADRLTSAGVLEQYSEHGKQAQRSNGESSVCFARQAMRNLGQWATGAATLVVQLGGLRTGQVWRPAPLGTGSLPRRDQAPLPFVDNYRFIKRKPGRN